MPSTAILTRPVLSVEEPVQNPTALLLAQDDPDEGGVEEIARSSVEGLVDLLPIPERLEWLAQGLISPGITVVLILLLAGILSRFAKRLIRRGVQRMKSPDGPTSRLRGRNRSADVVEEMRREQRADALGNVARSFVGVVVWSLAIIMAMGQIGVELGPLVAGAGIVGVALGFGAQDLVKDFLSGVFMLIEDQYGIGDIIDAGEAVGVVEGITLRSTRVRDLEGTLWHIPNGEIRRVGNMSQEFARALLDIGVAYSADIDAAADIIERVAVAMSTEEDYRELFVDAPEILGIEALGPDSVDIRLLIKTRPGKQWAISRELRRRIKNAFDAADVEIPFPQRTVWLRTESPVALGDATTPVHDATVPDERARRRAVEVSKRGDTGTPDEVADLLPPESATTELDPDEDGGRG